MLNGLYPYQDRHSFGPDMGPNCLLRLSADDQKSPLARQDKFSFIKGGFAQLNCFQKWQKHSSFLAYMYSGSHGASHKPLPALE